MIEFWEHNFKEKQTMWGFEPAESAIMVKDFFVTTQIVLKRFTSCDNPNRLRYESPL
jgi:hypothetical protein